MTAATRLFPAVAAVVAILALPASATALGTGTAANLDSVQAYVEKGGLPSGRLPVACGPKCATLWESEHALIPGQPTSDALHAELNTLRTKSKLLPDLATISNTFGKVVMGATAFTAGWEIGTTLRSIFTSEPVPPSPNTTYTQLYKLHPASAAGTVYNTTGGDKKFRYMFDPAYPTTGAPWTTNPPEPTTSVWTAGNGSDVAKRAYKPGCQYADQSYISGPAGLTRYTQEGQPNGCGSTPPNAGQVYGYAKPSAPRVTEELPAGAVKQGTRLNWPTGAQGTNGEPAATTRQRIADELDTGNYPATTAWLEGQLGPRTVPSCAGLTYAACAQALVDLDLVPSRTTLDFDHADLDKAGGAVVEVPAAGDELARDSEVEVIANPEGDDMPVKIPGPVIGETYDDYVARLQATGFHGTIERVDLTDVTLDPTKGPSAVTTTAPGTGQRVRPDGNVTVRVNPDTAPEVTPGGGGGPDVDSIDLTPLNVGQACDNFPLGVPCWAVDAISAWVVQGDVTAPKWTIPFPFVAESKYPVLDLADWQGPAVILRALILAVATLGIALRFFAFATGAPRGGDGDD